MDAIEKTINLVVVVVVVVVDVVVGVDVNVGAAFFCLHEADVAGDDVAAAAVAVFVDVRDDDDDDGIEKVKPIFESQEFCIGSRNRNIQLRNGSEDGADADADIFGVT